MTSYEEVMAAAGAAIKPEPVTVPQPDATVSPTAPAELSPKRPTEIGSAILLVIAGKVAKWLSVPVDDALLLLAGVPAAITWLVSRYREFKSRS